MGGNLQYNRNKYDWLGYGAYFWEQNYQRAWEWAYEGASRPNSNIIEPAVIGAVIDLGLCLNLLDSNRIHELKKQYEISKLEAEINGVMLPKNKNLRNNNDLLLRDLDCLIIEDLHENRKANGLPPYDSARGVFFEGGPIYETSGFMKKFHIQICIRNPNCIKGFFEPRQVDPNWRIPT